MRDAVLAILIIGGFFVVRAILATIFFFYLLPEGINCPNCDEPTVRVQSKGWNFLLPRFRTSWCLACRWHGLLKETKAPGNGRTAVVPPSRTPTRSARSR